MDSKLLEQLNNIPNSNGIYMMKNSDEKIIYIGKAKCLKNRVKSYFYNENHSPKIQVMVPQITKIDFITTDNEVEALILEDTLIKKHKPRYNTLLKDDKKFPWIEITDEDYPRILTTRIPSKKNSKTKSRFYGPYVNAGALYSTIDFLKQLFPLKQCKKPVFNDKPCMNYHIGRCLAPCQKKVSADEYKQVLAQVELFLTGKQTILLSKLEEMMKKASENLEFEKAAKYRDTIKSVEKVVESQKIVSNDNTINQDIFGFSFDKINLAIILFKIREGKLIYKEGFDLSINDLDSAEETFWAFLESYYRSIDSSQIPKEIIVPWISDEYELFISSLSKRKSQKVKLTLPKVRKKLELLQMAEKNAELILQAIQQKTSRMIQNQWNKVGIDLQEKLKLEHFPLRAECFDISHLSGSDTVASMVVFIKGKAQKSEYRKFKIKNNKGNIDDYASINEVIHRRYKKLKTQNTDWPDLIIVDGGKGQLSSALKSFKTLGIQDPPLVSLAKQFEEVFIIGQKQPVLFDKDSPSLYFFQQIRDEAHRFAISFQRELRSKRMTKSKLDELVSIGKKRKTLLLEHFGSVDKIFNATIEDLTKVKGINDKLALFIYNQLHNPKP